MFVEFVLSRAKEAKCGGITNDCAEDCVGIDVTKDNGITNYGEEGKFSDDGGRCKSASREAPTRNSVEDGRITKGIEIANYDEEFIDSCSEVKVIIEDLNEDAKVMIADAVDKRTCDSCMSFAGKSTHNNLDSEVEMIGDGIGDCRLLCKEFKEGI